MLPALVVGGNGGPPPGIGKKEGQERKERNPFVLLPLYTRFPPWMRPSFFSIPGLTLVLDASLILILSPFRSIAPSGGFRDEF
jgi:hypothetical protein